MGGQMWSDVLGIDMVVVVMSPQHLALPGWDQGRQTPAQIGERDRSLPEELWEVGSSWNRKIIVFSEAESIVCLMIHWMAHTEQCVQH